MVSSVGAQNMDSSGCQVSALENFWFYFETDQLETEAVSREGSGTTFSPQAFEDF